VLDSWDTIPNGYQKIQLHMMFDVKYELKHKVRLVVGVNWTASEKEDIYSGVVQMDTERIGFFSAELYELYYFAYDIGNDFYMEKLKRRCT
jgi:hypothetical protein